MNKEKTSLENKTPALSQTAVMRSGGLKINKKQEEWVGCVSRAKKTLKQGDRIRLTHCPGTKRTITFDHWDGNWIVSKSGKDDYSAMGIDKLNGQPISFRESVS